MVQDDLEASPPPASSGVKRKIISTQLPEDIIHNEILTRLPAKSILTFRLVCKSWKTLFSTSTFIESHLTRPHSYKDQDLIIAQKRNQGHGLFIISPSSQIKLTAVPLISDILLGSINGLVCMASGQEFCLWNPALGQLKEFHLQSQHSKGARRFLGFSWDHVLNEYKVVIVSYAPTPSSCRLSIYSSNSASWTDLVISDSVLPDISIFGRSLIKLPSTIVKGLPYWSYSNSLLLQGKKHNYISTLKFVAETNEIRLLPNLDLVPVFEKEFNLVNIKDRLIGMVYIKRYHDILVDMYSLNVESRSGVWSKMDSIGPINISMGNVELSQCFKNGGEILIVGFLYGSLCVYDPKTRQAKHIMNTRPCFFNRCFSYSPSLVCVQGMEPMQIPKNGVIVPKARVHKLLKKSSRYL